MIAIECFKKFRIIDLIIILFLSILFYLSNLVIISLSAKWIFFTFFLLLAIFITFTALLIRKAFSVTVFLTISSLLTYNLQNFYIIGSQKLLVFIITSFIFEIIFLILKIEIKNIPIDILFGAIISISFIPLIISLLLSSSIEFLINRFLGVFNLMLLTFFISIIGSVLGFLIWWNIRFKKFIVNFEYK